MIAKNTWAALKGREALKITWDDGPNKSYSSDSYKARCWRRTSQSPARWSATWAMPEAALKSAAKVITAEYYAPHLAHATMEPPAATARQVDGKWEVWAPLQSPGGARDDVAKALGIKPEEMTVHNTLLGGGFGRKSKCDYAIEAALLSKDIGGAPVKVVWTREDDIRHDFYHTVTADRFEAGLDASNKVIAWRHRSAAPTFMSNFVPDPKHPSMIELGMGWVDTPFDVPNIRMESGEAQSEVRIGWFRSVNNVMHAWSTQSFIAEIAAQLGKDPKDFLLEMIGPARIVDVSKQVTTEWWDYGEPYQSFPIDTGRLRKVTELAAERAGWGRQLPKGRGLGIAAHRAFVSYIATVVEVEVDAKGNITHPARRHGGGLRLLRQSGAGALADGGRGRDGALAREVRRDHAEGWAGRTVELQRLPDRPHRRVAARDPRAHRRPSDRRASERGGRARRSAVRARAVQRDLRRDRKAHPHAADRRSARVGADT